MAEFTMVLREAYSNDRGFVTVAGGCAFVDCFDSVLPIIYVLYVLLSVHAVPLISRAGMMKVEWHRFNVSPQRLDLLEWGGDVGRASPS